MDGQMTNKKNTQSHKSKTRAQPANKKQWWKIEIEQIKESQVEVELEVDGGKVEPTTQTLEMQCKKSKQGAAEIWYFRIKLERSGGRRKQRLRRRIRRHIQRLMRELPTPQDCDSFAHMRAGKGDAVARWVRELKAQNKPHAHTVCRKLLLNKYLASHPEVAPVWHDDTPWENARLKDRLLCILLSHRARKWKFAAIRCSSTHRQMMWAVSSEHCLLGEWKRLSKGVVLQWILNDTNNRQKTRQDKQRQQPCGVAAANALLGHQAIDDQALFHLHCDLDHDPKQYHTDGASAQVLCTALRQFGLRYAGPKATTDKLLLYASNHWTALTRDQDGWKLHDGDMMTRVENIESHLVGHTVLAFGNKRVQYKGPWLTGLMTQEATLTTRPAVKADLPDMNKLVPSQTNTPLGTVEHGCRFLVLVSHSKLSSTLVAAIRHGDVSNVAMPVEIWTAPDTPPATRDKWYRLLCRARLLSTTSESMQLVKAPMNVAAPLLPKDATSVIGRILDQIATAHGENTPSMLLCSDSAHPRVRLDLVHTEFGHECQAYNFNMIVIHHESISLILAIQEHCCLETTPTLGLWNLE
jgi:hypothetical protein